jgi:hypothetical protein
MAIVRFCCLAATNPIGARLSERGCMSQRQQPLQLGRVEADQVEVEALVAQPS